MAAAYTWGFGKYGQLGNSKLNTCETPQLTRLPAGARPKQVSAGAHFTLILAEKCQGEPKKAEASPTISDARGDCLFACGWGKYGRLGTGSEEDQPSPSAVALPGSELRPVVQVSAGHWHAGCVTEEGVVFMWGYNKSGMLGVSKGSSSDAATPTSPFVLIPTPLPSPVHFKSIACGYNYTYAISTEGTVYSWGANRCGVLGHGDTADRPRPEPVAAVREAVFVAVACGYSHAALVESTGHLYTVGSGEGGALGHGKDKRDKHVPTLVQLLASGGGGGVEVSNASCTQGERHPHTLCCSREGEVWSWGDGYKGKLGHNSQESYNVPCKIDSKHFLSKRVCQVACGGIHSAARTEDGCVFTWGCGSDGRLGHPEAHGHRYLFRSDVPRLVEGLGRDSQAVGSYQLHLVLTCSTTGEVSHKLLSLERPPILGRDLKKAVETSHQIPCFAQTLHYESAEFADEDSLQKAHLRNGDTVQITYTAAAECEDVHRAVGYLRQLVGFLQEQLPTSDDQTSQGAVLLAQAFNGGFAHLLTEELFRPWQSEVKQMNKDLFMHTNGLRYLLELQSLLLDVEWEKSTNDMKRMERVILQTIYHLASTFKLRGLLIQEGVVELCTRSLLRTKLQRKATLPWTTPLPGVIASAMGTLCNMCEVRETHIRIGSNPNALEQFICIAHCQEYTCWCAQLAINAFVCFAQAPEVHPHMAAESVIEGMLSVCRYREQFQDDPMDVTLLRHFTQLVLSQLVLVSPSFLPSSVLEGMYQHMSKFLAEVDADALAQHEKSTGCFWSVFEPFIKLLYIPNTPLVAEEKEMEEYPPSFLSQDNVNTSSQSRDHIISRLQLLAIQTTLLALYMMLLDREDGHVCVEGMQRENLISFIIAAPSHVPTALRGEAIKLTQRLGSHTTLQPPSLVSLAKASLAKFHFGLERVLQMRSPHELVKEYYGMQH